MFIDDLCFFRYFSSHFMFFVLVDKGYEKWKYNVIVCLLLLLLFFIFVLPVLPCKRKTWYRKSRNPSDGKKTNLPKNVMSRAKGAKPSPSKALELRLVFLIIIHGSATSFVSQTVPRQLIDFIFWFLHFGLDISEM